MEQEMMERNEMPAVISQENNLSISSGDFILPDPEAIAKRAEQTKKMMSAVCKVLSPKSIVDFGGEPFIDHIGCSRIAQVFSLVVRANTDEQGNIAYKKEMEDADTNKYTVKITGRIWHKNSPDNYQVYEGSCSSFNDFLRAYQTVEKDENGKNKVVSAKFVPESKVQEKALANFTQRAIKKYLGLSFTWEELEEYGIKRDNSKGFSFKNTQAADSKETSELRAEVWKKILEMANGDEATARATIKKHTTFPKKDGTTFEGYTDIAKVSEKMLAKLAEKVNNEYIKFCESAGI